MYNLFSHSHLFLSVLSFLLFGICLIVLLIKMPSVFTFAFVESIDQTASLYLTLLTMLKSVSHALLFTFESRSMMMIVLLTEIAIHIPFIVSNITRRKDKLLFDLYFTKMLGVKHSWSENIF